MSLISYNEVLEARRRLGEMFAVPGVVRGNVDICVKGNTVFKQIEVTNPETGEQIVVKEVTSPFAPPEARQQRLIVIHTSAQQKH